MKTKLVQYLFLAQIAILIVLAGAISACTSESDGNGGETIPPLHPDAAAGARASVMTVEISADEVAEFSSSQQSINEDWDQFHVDFDRWRNGLTACDRAAAEAALRVFASDFGAITEQARDLPGKGIARELPDDVISAASAEEASLRLLRDNWQPGNPDLLEEAQSERADAARMLRAAQIAVDILEEMDDPEDREIAKEFADALETVNEAWDAFNDSYAELEDEHLDLDLDEIVTRLKALEEEHEVVVESLQGIASDKVTDGVQDPLIDAAEQEAEALGDLVDAFRRAARAENEVEAEAEAAVGENGSNGPAMIDRPNGPETETNGAGEPVEPGGEPANGAPQGAAEDAVPGNTGLGQASDQWGPHTQGGSNGIPVLPFFQAGATPEDSDSAQDTNGRAESGSEEVDYSAHFDTFEDTLDDTRAIRRKANRDLEALVEGFSEQDRKALSEFIAAFDRLMDNWDAFHADFDEWIRTEGNCNRASAISALNEYDQEFGELGNRIRELSQASYLRPSSDLLAEAVEREGAALRSLAGTWAPYESDVYRGLDAERSNADKLRRLADLRLQELMERNGMQQ